MRLRQRRTTSSLRVPNLDFALPSPSRRLSSTPSHRTLSLQPLRRKRLRHFCSWDLTVRLSAEPGQSEPPFKESSTGLATILEQALPPCSSVLLRQSSKALSSAGSGPT